jgi:hypothetical protein
VPNKANRRAEVLIVPAQSPAAQKEQYHEIPTGDLCAVAGIDKFVANRWRVSSQSRWLSTLKERGRVKWGSFVSSSTIQMIGALQLRCRGKDPVRRQLPRLDPRVLF